MVDKRDENEIVLVPVDSLVFIGPVKNIVLGICGLSFRHNLPAGFENLSFDGHVCTILIKLLSPDSLACDKSTDCIDLDTNGFIIYCIRDSYFYMFGR